MASVEKNVTYTLTLTLTEDEARGLREYLGDSGWTIGSVIEDVYDALQPHT